MIVRKNLQNPAMSKSQYHPPGNNRRKNRFFYYVSLKKNGGGERFRTDDLRLAKPALSQLSYTPINFKRCIFVMVGLDRFELSTSRLSGVRSNQLSYRPAVWRFSFIHYPPGGYRLAKRGGAMVRKIY